MTTVHCHHLRDGELEVSEPTPGRFVVSWKPHRADHPDYPGITLDSERDDVPTSAGIEGVIAWADEHFDSRDERRSRSVLAPNPRARARTGC